MNKFISLIISLFIPCFLLFLLSSCQSASQKTEKKIGIIVPLENKSLDEIVAGFTETLRAKSSDPIKFKVANAQGDINLQRAIIQQMKDERYDIIVPIGTTATQMAAASIKEQPIIGLAASYSEQERKKQNPCNIVIVYDEIPSKKVLNFIHEVYPTLNHLTFIHSASDKIFPEIKIAIPEGKTLGITIKPLMAQTLSDLYSVANSLPNNTQGIFILKDIMIASGIATLEKIAEKRGIPLITSDQGSVQEGAAFALGVHERDIGKEGAILAAAILSGKSACELPMVDMKHLTVFVNPSGLKKENQIMAPIQRAAKKLNYTIELTDK